MIHVSEISAEKRIGQPAEVLRVGQKVQALIIAIDPEKRQIRLSMKQLVPTGIDEYLAEHKEGDVVTGRFMDVSGSSANDQARVELGDGIHAACSGRAAASSAKSEAKADVRSEAKADLSSLSSMLQARWKTGSGGPAKAEPAKAGQVRSFRIVKLDLAAKKIEVELA
jgi:small subunit ribosomal protein S1